MALAHPIDSHLAWAKCGLASVSEALPPAFSGFAEARLRYVLSSIHLRALERKRNAGSARPAVRAK